MKSKRHINLKKTVEKAFKQTAEAYDRANKEVIQQPRDWGSGFGVTKRRNGEVVIGGYRNIVDLGNLKDGQTLSFTKPLTATYEWQSNETPVSLVYWGYRTKNGFVPSRKWTEEALKEIDLSQVFIISFKENL